MKLSYLFNILPVVKKPLSFARRGVRGEVLSGILLALSFPAFAQLTPTSTRNYVVEQTPRTAQTAISLSSPYTGVISRVSYFDGLGRPLETIQVRGAGDATTDLISSALTYDAYGRPQQTLLPVPGTGSSGAFVTVANALTQGQAASVYNDSYPYSETSYEASPLSRPTTQYGPGQTWRTQSKAVQVSYGVAVANTVIRFKVNTWGKVIYGNIEGNGTQWEYYSATDVATKTTTDEQGNQTIEYQDTRGKILRKDVLITGQTLTTAYVYDDFERLTAVIPPKLYQWFVSNGSGQALFFYQGNTDNPIFKDNAYVYIYDTRSRVIRKHIPSAGWTDLVYDRLDRLVMAQDQQDATDAGGAKWRFTKYDGLGRAVQTGRITLPMNATTLQATFSGQTSTDEERGSSLWGYTNRSFPTGVSVGANDVLTVNYYDDYGAATQAYQSANALATPFSTVKGLLSATKTRNLETLDWYDASFWYDDKGRIVQQQSKNHLGGTDRTDNLYGFSGELQRSVLRHQTIVNNVTSNTVITTAYAYDHLSRPVSLSYGLNDAPLFEMARYQYDALGRMSQKLIQPGGSYATNSWLVRTQNPATTSTTDQYPAYIELQPDNLNLNSANGVFYEAKIGGTSGTTPALQTVRYSYHLRGWLRGINLNASGQPALDATKNDLFAFKLSYEEASPATQYNGNISQQQWVNSRDASQVRGYLYYYDKANRLTMATYLGPTGEDVGLNTLTYDPNGNLLTLNRANVDQLHYSYGPGNSLTAVSDDITYNQDTGDFRDGNTAGADYTYWPDGSLRQDKNQGISEIQYNLLKLPRQVSFSNGKVVSYTYTASGQKLRMQETPASGAGGLRDYVGPLQYLNNSLLEIAHPEGRYTPATGYEYFLTDHLGNVRVTYNASGLLQWSNYDPLGYQMPTLSGGTSSNRLKYNGKEAIGEVGSNLYDFGARLYNAPINRWFVVDPLAENHYEQSPFNFVLNNPLLYADAFGLDTVRANTPQPIQQGDVVKLDNGSMFTSSANEVVVRVNTGSSNSSSADKSMVVPIAFPGAYQLGEGIGQGLLTGAKATAGAVVLAVALVLMPTPAEAPGTSIPTGPFVLNMRKPKSRLPEGKPGDLGPLNGKLERHDPQTGALQQERWYGPDGKPLKDKDYGHDHGAGDPHIHDWTYKNPGAPNPSRGPGRALKPGE